MLANNKMIRQRQRRILRNYYGFNDVRPFARAWGIDDTDFMYELLDEMHQGEMRIQQRRENRARQLLRRGIRRQQYVRQAHTIGDDWITFVRREMRNNLGVPFTLTLRSATIAGLTRKFNFNSFYMFENWVNAIVNADYSGGSGTVRTFRDTLAENPDAFAEAILSITMVEGGCNKCRGEQQPVLNRKIKGTYNTFNIFNPLSTHNNCALVCIENLLEIKLNYKEVREEFLLKRDVPIEVSVVMQIYNKYNIHARFLVIVDRDTALKLDTEKYDYLLHDKNHYTIIQSIEKCEEHKNRKRGLMAMDFETRPTEEFVMVGKTESYLLKDTICSVAYQEHNQKVKDCPLIRNTFITNNNKSSARQFLDFLELEHRRGKHYNIVAYNGSRFDYYFLIAQLTEEELLHTEVNLRGYSVIGINYYDHEFRDPNCFLVGSLSKLCTSFKVDTPKMTTFELNGKTITNENLCFYKPELSFNEFLELEHKEPDYWKLYVEYCEYDCISLRELWIKFMTTTEVLVRKMEPKILRYCSVSGSKTIGSLAKKMIDNLQKHDTRRSYKWYEKFFNGEDGNVDMEKYNFVCNFKRGGISHCNQPGKHNHPVTGIDLCSQYPTSMKYMKIPAGYSKFYKDGKYYPELYGFYKLKNLKFKEGTPLFKPVSSKDLKTGVLQWNNETIDELYIDSELLKYMIKHYGLISFDVETSLLGESYKKGSDIFGVYVDTLFAEKARQDELKEAKDPAYNVALREVIKLFLNSLSGKMVEDPSHYKGLKYANHTKGKNINGVGVEQEDNDQINLWVGTGVMIYSYSKRNLFEYIRMLPNDANDVIHIETDGIYFDARLMSKFEKNLANYKGEYPIAMGNELGHIKVEHISQGESYWLGKKFYYMYDKGDVIRIKGIPVKTIDDWGNKVDIVTKELYEQVYNWKPIKDEKGKVVNPIKRSFKTLRKQLWGQTQISSHTMSRTITPRMTYQVYN